MSPLKHHPLPSASLQDGTQDVFGLVLVPNETDMSAPAKSIVCWRPRIDVWSSVLKLGITPCPMCERLFGSSSLCETFAERL